MQSFIFFITFPPYSCINSIYNLQASIFFNFHDVIVKPFLVIMIMIPWVYNTLAHKVSPLTDAPQYIDPTPFWLVTRGVSNPHRVFSKL